VLQHRPSLLPALVRKRDQDAFYRVARQEALRTCSDILLGWGGSFYTAQGCLLTLKAVKVVCGR
jgi:hypothetical protein